MAIVVIMETPSTPKSNSDRSRPWRQLPVAVQTQILSLLPPNDRALSGRLVSPDARDGLSGPQHCTAFLAQPLPPHAALLSVAAGQQHVRQLPFRHKLKLLCTAAASGSEVNLEVALALLQPSILPGHLQSRDGPDPGLLNLLGSDNCTDPGVAAVKAGHPQLLGWLVRHCPNLMRPWEVLAAAARHYSLAELQATWEALQAHPRFSASNTGYVWAKVLKSAAESVTPDTVAKMEWLLATAGSSCSMDHNTVKAAARSGDVARLLWLRGRGCPVGDWEMLLIALQHAELAMAQWLVEEAGCQLPVTGGGDMAVGDRHGTWTELMQAAAKSSDAAAKWQWLHERGGPSLQGTEQWVVEVLAELAVTAGQVEAVQYLLSVLGPGKVLGVNRDALNKAAGRSGSIPVAECLQQAGLVLSHKAYGGAAGKLPFVRWLALEAKVSAAGFTCRELQNVILNWPSNTSAHSRDLLEAVQLLAGAGFSNWRGERLTDAAARRGDLGLVRFLVEQGAPLDPDMGTVRRAAAAGCEHLLELLTAQPGCFKPLAFSTSTPYTCAAEHGDRATLDALRRLGVPWGPNDKVFFAVGEWCGLPALRWLVKHGAPLGSVEQLRRVVACAVERRGLSAEAAAWLRGLVARDSGAMSGRKERRRL